MEKPVMIVKRMRFLCVFLLCVLMMPSSRVVAQMPFAQWLTEFRQEALNSGVSAATFDDAFEGVQPKPRVVELDRSQPEFKLTLDQYVGRVVPQRRIDIGRRKLAEHTALLNKVSAKYGVQPRFIVAFWGIETDFGRLTGGFYVIEALATLAYDGRRSAFFRKQLLDALLILDEGHIARDQMTGSWAGAMGQAQFMPSTFRAYAVDFDGDKRIDLWNSKADVFASAANYLSQVGWRDDQTWGREVLLPKGFNGSHVGRKNRQPLAQWQSLGVRRLNGQALPTRSLDAGLIQPDGPGSRAFLVYRNFDSILNWNRSERFGVAVGTLADAVAKGQ